MSGSKFSGVLARLKDVLPEERDETPSPSMPPASDQTKIGRPPGKRSDPDWSPRTILMNRHTHKSVQRILLENDDERDLSELVDELLRGWIDKAT
ncbi:MAG: hypothetical protein JO110_03750 [Acetobacteraceae bacterium]|nr:hypothetical protein [Acetobacteraceae bacterium]